MYDDAAHRGDFVRRDPGYFEVPEPQVDGGFIALRAGGLGVGEGHVRVLAGGLAAVNPAVRSRL